VFTSSVAQLAAIIEGTICGDASLEIQGVQSLNKSRSTDITFLESEKNLFLLKTNQPGALITAPQLAEKIPEQSRPAAIILVADAQEAFLKVLTVFKPERPRAKIGISPQAHLADETTVGEGCNIFTGATISDDVEIGDHCDIHPGVVVGPGCRIGNNVVLHPNVVLYPDVLIGNNVIIHASAVLGADGFGYRFQQGQFLKIPHRGGVRIEDDVEIGACTTIDRGMIDSTVIGQGTKIDNQVMIAHNCEIGRHNAFASQVGFAGSVTTGDYVRCGGQAGIADHVHLGEGCSLGAKTGVHKDIPATETHLGIPATPESEQRRILMAVKKTPQMKKQIRQLEKQLSELSDQLQQLTSASDQNMKKAG